MIDIKWKTRFWCTLNTLILTLFAFLVGQVDRHSGWILCIKNLKNRISLITQNILDLVFEYDSHKRRMRIEYSLQVLRNLVQSIQYLDHKVLNQMILYRIFICDSINLNDLDHIQINSPNGQVDHESKLLIWFEFELLQETDIMWGFQEFRCSLCLHGWHVLAHFHEVLENVIGSAGPFGDVNAVELDFHDKF